MICEQQFIKNMPQGHQRKMIQTLRLEIQNIDLCPLFWAFTKTEGGTLPEIHTRAQERGGGDSAPNRSRQDVPDDGHPGGLT